MEEEIKEKLNEIILRENEKSLHISRIPRKTRDLFIKLADEEFAEDYGLCLKYLLEQALEYQQMKYSLFNGLLKPEQSTASPEEKKPTKKTMLDGTVIEGGKIE